jgi:hypothetical protein
MITTNYSCRSSTGVGGQETREISWVTQWCIALQCALEVVNEVGALGMFGVLRIERPEGVFVRSECERFTCLRFVIGILAEDHEVAVSADEDLAVVR